MRDDFAVFILAHGRPEKLYTLNTLKKSGYSGKYYIILDNEDSKIEEYKEKFGADKIKIFDKLKYSKTFDIMDNFSGRNVIVFARNACFDIARELGLKYFAEFEDDYINFTFRHEYENSLLSLNIQDSKNIDSVFTHILDFLSKTNIRTIAFAQNGEMVGGLNGSVWKKKLLRKAMNTFFFKVGEKEEDLTFVGRLNDDVNTYVSAGSVGEIFLTTAIVNLKQVLTQQSAGGNTEAYNEFGTYVKSFYSVMKNPSSVKIKSLGTASPRIHHSIDWKNTVPCIISDRFKK